MKIIRDDVFDAAMQYLCGGGCNSILRPYVDEVRKMMSGAGKSHWLSSDNALKLLHDKGGWWRESNQPIEPNSCNDLETLQRVNQYLMEGMKEIAQFGRPAKLAQMAKTYVAGIPKAQAEIAKWPEMRRDNAELQAMTERFPSDGDSESYSPEVYAYLREKYKFKDVDPETWKRVPERKQVDPKFIDDYNKFLHREAMKPENIAAAAEWSRTHEHTPTTTKNER